MRMQADSAHNVRMWNAVDGQPDHQAKNASDAVGWEQEYQPNRGPSLLELSGVRQRVPQGAFY
jgi:hypothetical protein